jgi:hypothetical protein
MDKEPGLKIVDAFDLDPEVRSLLMPQEMAEGKDGHQHKLPRYFYEIPSHEAAREVRLSQHFGLNELLLVDLKEAERLRAYPRYVPCAVRILAFYLERLREAVGAPIHLAVNGGYRSPAHKLSVGATPHMWGTAADLYRIGSQVLNEKDTIEKFNRLAEETIDDFWVMPYGHEIGKTDDHIHLDLGYVSLVPREMSEDRSDEPQAEPRFAIEERRRRADRRTSDRDSPEEPAPEG